MVAVAPSLEDRLHELLAACIQQEAEGQLVDRARVLAENPDLAEALRSFWASHDRMNSIFAPLRQAPAGSPPGAASPLALATAMIALGEIGDYELHETIAAGGMGLVVRARQRALNRVVALKLIVGGSGDHDAAVQRFAQEAEAAAGLHHERIVPVYDVGFCQGVHYYAMRLMEGGSLRQHMGPRGLAGSPKEELASRRRWIAQTLAEVADAVHFAHQRGVLHRDLKPGNILMDAEGRPHVSDFGLAKRLGVDGLTITQTGAALGTPAYMSPEQARGDKVITVASDVYSLGAMLYELLTGRPPLRGDTALQTLRLIEVADPVAPSRVSPNVDPDAETICLKCLKKEATRRYESAKALAEDLRRWGEGEPISARPPTATERLALWTRQHRPTVVGVCVGLAAALILLTLTLVAYVRESSLRAREQEAKQESLQRQADLEQALEATAAERMAAEQAKQQAREALASAEASLRDAQQGSQTIRRQMVSLESLRVFVFNVLGQLHTRLGADEPALARLAGDIMLTLPPESEQPALNATVLHAIGRMHMRAGLRQDGMRLLQDATSLLERHGLWRDLQYFLCVADQLEEEMLAGTDPSEVEAKALMALKAVALAGLPFPSAERAELALRRVLLEAQAQRLALHELLAQQRSLLRLAERAHPRSHPECLDAHLGLITPLAAMGKMPSAQREAETLLEAAMAQGGPPGHHVALALRRIGELSLLTGDPAGAIQPLQQSVEVSRAALGEMVDVTQLARLSLAVALARVEPPRLSEATPMALDASAKVRELHPPPSEHAVAADVDAAQVLLRAGLVDAARDRLQIAIHEAQLVGPQAQAFRRDALLCLGQIHMSQGRWEAAVRPLAEAWQISTLRQGLALPELVHLAADLSESLHRSGQPAAAQGVVYYVVDLIAQAEQTADPNLERAVRRLSEMVSARGPQRQHRVVMPTTPGLSTPQP